ncbi:uncharacterized protein [Nicotiana sylvestris]|uniref:Uncharacterized protein LOC104246341 n=1 Tax=Nicotiana sylvestris TaxID=4096 RepID=A0A1U7YBF2_NICSY|nr:PREDICTED: uncharacterized protein LOC104246341 [Nicotiana sylvestris]
MQEKTRMQKKRSVVGRRAWNILRVALLWARKGGIFKNRHLMADLRLLPKYIKSLRHSNDYGYGSALHYGERELSFDDTPIIHVKMHRPTSLRFKMPNIPCIKPQVDFDFDFDFENDRDREEHEMFNGNDDDVPRKCFLKCVDDDNEEDSYASCEVSEEISCPGDEAIDVKAEEFIAKFYEQIKLQRQISYLQYHETTLAN